MCKREHRHMRVFREQGWSSVFSLGSGYQTQFSRLIPPVLLPVSHPVSPGLINTLKSINQFIDKIVEGRS